jgi:hypothetical protein
MIALTYRTVLTVLAVGASIVMLGARAANVNASQTGAVYVPAATEVSALLAPLDVIPNDSVNDGWDASAGFTVVVNAERGFDLFASARVLASEAEGRSFFDDVGGAVSTDNERTSASKSPEIARQLNADEVWEMRLIYNDPDLKARQSDYARLVRYGRVVTLIEAIGDPALDDSGKVDEVRERSINRLSELIAGKVAFYPVDPARQIPALAPFARAWSRHGMTLNLDQAGHGELTWRIYRWCQDDPAPPCDRLQNNVIDPGGGAAIAFTRVDGRTAYGVVIGSADIDTLDIGPVSLTLRDDGTAALQQGGEPMVLCGPDFTSSDSPAVQRESLCGA